MRRWREAETLGVRRTQNPGLCHPGTMWFGGPFLLCPQSPHTEIRALKTCIWSVPHITPYPPSLESEITQMGIEQHK